MDIYEECDDGQPPICEDNSPLFDTGCISCGQCVVACPKACIVPADDVPQVLELLANKGGKTVVAMTAPTVPVTISELYNLPAGTDSAPSLVAALRAAGFDHVFDVTAAADVTIMEEGAELLQRLTAKNTPGAPALPMFTSCCPGWIALVEKHYPELIPHLSTCKSPQGMAAALIKNVWAPGQGLKPEDVVVVSMMPCVAKKGEAARQQLSGDVDVVLTVTETARLLAKRGVASLDLPKEDYDAFLGGASGAGDIFGATGGVMEAALRFVHEKVTGEELIDIPVLRGPEPVREATLDVGGTPVRVAVVTGSANAREFVEQVLAGERYADFVEVMACPRGCISGGGNPGSRDEDLYAERAAGLYRKDAGKPLRKSQDTPAIRSLYGENGPLSDAHRAHELLHTHYGKL
eukprot:gnl/Ergobibamus_cyprinoides/95.p1 GENE.gnl/Ergobibamus_cyprinoides/95~~gnl/Ergobibamus_cyprinoides/95.p1  ORF type:complete len:407 (+),score=148.82 gnl/Ergobibamus_cyprinoides/95:117-1337(+)